MKKLSVLWAILILLMGAAGASAKATYTVKKGDTLYDIARKFNTTVHEIEKANKGASKPLKPGSKLVIPAQEGRSAKAAGKKLQDEKATTEASVKSEKQEDFEAVPAGMPSSHEKVDKDAVRTVRADEEADKYHTVRKGDTLRSIAKKYRIPESDIRALNDLQSSRLAVGRKLLVTLRGPKTYVVHKGDTLWKIARKFDMDPDDLMEINEMTSPDLKVGRKLYLEEKPEVVNVDHKYLIMAKHIEEELKRVPESPEFAEKTTQDKIVTFARKLLHIPYKFGGNTIFGIDCSAYVKKVYGLMGVNLPRTAREQYKEGEDIEKEELSVGDLVFFRTYASFPSHVGIYLGNNLFIHASSKGRKVTIDNLETPYYLKRFIGGKRLISASEEQEKAALEPAS